MKKGLLDGFWRRFFVFEDNVKDWIEKHFIKWIMVLTLIGVSFSFFFNYLLGGSFRQGLTMATVFVLFLIIVEIAVRWFGE